MNALYKMPLYGPIIAVLVSDSLLLEMQKSKFVSLETLFSILFLQAGQENTVRFHSPRFLPLGSLLRDAIPEEESPLLRDDYSCKMKDELIQNIINGKKDEVDFEKLSYENFELLSQAMKFCNNKTGSYIDCPLAVLAAVSITEVDCLSTAQELISDSLKNLKQKHDIREDYMQKLVILVKTTNSSEIDPSPIFSKLKGQFGEDGCYYISLMEDSSEIIEDSSIRFDIKGQLGSTPWFYPRDDLNACIPSDDSLITVKNLIVNYMYIRFYNHIKNMTDSFLNDFKKNDTWSLGPLKMSDFKNFDILKLFDTPKESTCKKGSEPDLNKLKRFADILFMVNERKDAARIYSHIVNNNQISNFPVNLLGQSKIMIDLIDLLDGNTKIENYLKNLQKYLMECSDLGLPGNETLALISYSLVLRQHRGFYYNFAKMLTSICVWYVPRTLPISYPIVLEFYAWIAVIYENISISKFATFLYIAGDGFHQNKLYSFSYKCYNITNRITTHLGHKYIRTGINSKIGDSLRNLGKINEALSYYANILSFDTSEYKNIIKSFALLDKLSVGEYTSEKQNFLMNLPLPYIDTNSIKIETAFLELEDKEIDGNPEIYYKLIIDGSCKDSNSVPACKFFVNDKIVIEFDIVNEFNAGFVLSKFILETDNSERIMIKHQNITIEPNTRKRCAFEAMSTTPGNTVIHGYSFYLNNMEFHRKLGNQQTSRGSIEILSMYKSIDFFFEGIEKGLFCGEIRNIKFGLKNASDHDLIVRRVSLSNKAFICFREDSTELSQNEQKENCKTGDRNINNTKYHEIYNILDNECSYYNPEDHKFNLTVPSNTSKNLHFTIWARDESKQTYSISISYYILTNPEENVTMNFKINLVPEKIINSSILISSRSGRDRSQIVQLDVEYLNKCVEVNELSCFSPTRLLSASYSENKSLDSRSTFICKVVETNKSISSDSIISAKTWERILEYAFRHEYDSQDYNEVNEDDLTQIFESKITFIHDKENHSLSKNLLMAIIYWDLGQRRLEFLKNLHDWLTEEHIKRIFRFLYENDLILTTVWVDKSKLRIGVNNFIDTSITDNNMINMLSFLFKSIIHSQKNSENKNISHVVLSSSQRLLAGGFHLNGEDLPFRFLNVYFEYDHIVEHDFDKRKYCKLDVAVTLDNEYLGKNIEFSLIINGCKKSSSFSWEGYSRADGLLKCYEKRKLNFVAIFYSYGTYDISTWLLQIYPEVVHECPDYNESIKLSLGTYEQVSQTPMIIKVVKNGSKGSNA